MNLESSHGSTVLDNSHASFGAVIGFFLSFFSNHDVWMAMMTAIACSVAVKGFWWGLGRLFPAKKGG